MLIYGIINLGYTKISGKPVYKVFSFDSAKSWLMAISTLLVGAILYLIIFGLTRLKFKIFNENKIKEETSENSKGIELKKIEKNEEIDHSL